MKAIENRLGWFIDTIQSILDSVTSKTALQKILGPTTEDEEKRNNRETCIHVAVKEQNTLGSVRIVKLIEAASQHTLAAGDETGLTPLHHMVHYSRCTQANAKIVEALIQYGEAAFDRYTPHDERSVYQYHVFIQQQEERKKTLPFEKRTANRVDHLSLERFSDASEDEEIKEKENKSVDLWKDFESDEEESKVSPVLVDDFREIEPDAQAYQSDEIDPAEALAQPFGYRRASTLDIGCRKAPMTQTNRGFELHQPNVGRHLMVQGNNKPQIHSEEMISISSKEALTTLEGARRLSRGFRTPSGDDPDQAAKVAKLLKLHYLRSTFRNQSTDGGPARTYETALHFLYGKYSERELLFVAWEWKLTDHSH